MTDRDLTPDEARAEVEAFMGEGWKAEAFLGDLPEFYVTASTTIERGVWPYTRTAGRGPTYRAAVDALLQAWRDAVRPWVAEAVHESGTHAARIAKTYDEAPERRAWDTAEAAILTDLHDPDDPDTLRVIARVLKEDK